MSPAVLKQAGISRSTLTEAPADGQQRAQQHEAVGRAQQRVARPLGVRHQADDVAPLVADSGDVVDRAIWVVDVAQHDPVIALQLGQRPGEQV